MLRLVRTSVSTVASMLPVPADRDTERTDSFPPALRLMLPASAVTLMLTLYPCRRYTETEEVEDATFSKNTALLVELVTVFGPVHGAGMTSGLVKLTSYARSPSLRKEIETEPVVVVTERAMLVLCTCAVEAEKLETMTLDP
jgi:hypothetical protein